MISKTILQLVRSKKSEVRGTGLFFQTALQKMGRRRIEATIREFDDGKASDSMNSGTRRDKATHLKVWVLGTYLPPAPVGPQAKTPSLKELVTLRGYDPLFITTQASIHTCKSADT